MWTSTNPGTAIPAAPGGRAPSRLTRSPSISTSPSRSLPSTRAARTPSRIGRPAATVSTQDAGLIALVTQTRQNLFGMLGAAGLHHQLDRGLPHLQVEPLTDVRDVHQIGARCRHAGQETREAAGAVGHAG